MALNHLAISDIEGRYLQKLLDTTEYKQESTQVIICGDVLDSTFFNPIDETDYRYEEKKYNLRNLLLIYNNDNIHLISGNRDIDKIEEEYLVFRCNYDETNY